jgi:hypothetical protein
LDPTNAVTLARKALTVLPDHDELFYDANTISFSSPNQLKSGLKAIRMGSSESLGDISCISAALNYFSNRDQDVNIDLITSGIIPDKMAPLCREFLSSLNVQDALLDLSLIPSNISDINERHRLYLSHRLCDPRMTSVRSAADKGPLHSICHSIVTLIICLYTNLDGNGLANGDNDEDYDYTPGETEMDLETSTKAEINPTDLSSEICVKSNIRDIEREIGAYDGSTEWETKAFSMLSLAMQRCYLVIRDLMTHSIAASFNYPVDPRQAPMYNKIMLQPVCLSDIKQAILFGVYGNSIFKFYSDVNFVFENASAYNVENSVLNSSVQKLIYIFERLFLEMVLMWDNPLPFFDRYEYCLDVALRHISLART